MQEKLFQKSVTFISLDLSYSTDMAVNKLIATNLAAIATFEHERRRERQREGLLATQKEGKFWIARISIVEELYFYKYPFSFPNYFLLYKDKSDMDFQY